MNLTVLVAAAAILIAAPALADTTVVPDPVLTPGAVRTTDPVEICSTGTRQLRHWSRSRDDRILAEYGLSPGPHPSLEIDHLIPLGIGGADDDSNLWPQRRRAIEPDWPAEKKDDLEFRLRDLICSGQLDVREAQKAVADDWIEAYRRLFGSYGIPRNHLRAPARKTRP
jgi:hypothetical protein